MLSMFISLLKSWSHVHLALIVSHAEVINIVPTELSHLRIIVLFEVKKVCGVRKS